MSRDPITLATDLGFTEGPVILSNGDIVVTSITKGALYLVTPDRGSRLLANLGGGANGATVDASGTIYVAQNGGRWAVNGPSWLPSSVGGVQVVRSDGSHDWLTREPIAPNDLCFGPDGQLYVTDPTRSKAIDDGRVWRIDPETGRSTLLASVGFFCNGIAFDADDHLYLAATNNSRIYRCDLAGDTITTPEVAIQMTKGTPDGMAFASDGSLVIGAIDHDGQGTIQTWTLDGKQVGEFVPGEGSLFTNVAFDGKGGLVIAASDNSAVMLVPDWGDPGLPLHPFRAS